MEKVTNLKQMANIFNKYFPEVGQKIAADIKEPINLKKSICTSLLLLLLLAFPFSQGWPQRIIISEVQFVLR